MDWPINTLLTVSWDALIQAGEHNEGHCLDRMPWERAKYLRDELRRLSRSRNQPFVAIWGRDIGQQMGEHVHLAMFLPSRHLRLLASLLERVTGSSADYVLSPYSKDVVARSVCGGWQINLNKRTDGKASAITLAEYIAAQHDKHALLPAPSGKAFGVSQAIGKTAQEAF